MKFNVCSILSVAVLAVVASPLAQAVTITGSVYSNQSGPVPATSAGIVNPSTNKSATFTATSINFCVQDMTCAVPFSGSYTIGGFLGSQGNASGVSGVNYLNGFTSGSTLNNTLFEFTGSALFTNGQTFTVSHDDGTVMYVNGVQVVNQPNATSAATTTYTYGGTTGVYNFDFLYGEIAGAPAVYQTTLQGPLTAATPEPGSIVLLGSGLISVAGLVRRRFKA